jgi:hypothetical protein
MKVVALILLGAVLSSVGSAYGDSVINVLCLHHKPVPDSISIAAPAPEDHAISP